MPGKNRKIQVIKHYLINFLNLIEILVYPSKCKICNSPLGNYYEKAICNNCYQNLKPFRGPCCILCGKPFRAPYSFHFCSDCLKEKPPFKIHRSAGLYDGTLKELILLFKFRKIKSLGGKLALFLYNSTKIDINFSEIDFIIPVPLHKKRLKERGFNQSELISKEINRMVNKKILNDVLVKRKNTIPQTLIDFNERKRNIHGAFQLKNAEVIKDKNILLVDDVYTTGSTIFECAKTLLKGNPKSISIITLARSL
ncbi:MAG: ComF family protein [Acidobacteriota bacterium]